MAAASKTKQTANSIDPMDCYITVKLAAEYLGKSTFTVYRWINKGHNGHCIRAVYVGADLCTKRRWLDDFVAATQPQSSVAVEENEALQQRLIAAGLK